MKECSERAKRLMDNMAVKSSWELFEMIENELNTRITAVISNKRVYGNDLYTNRIKIDGIVFCSEYNVLKANLGYLVFASKLINEKIKLEKITALYNNVVNTAVEGLTENERKGVRAVLEKIDNKGSLVTVKDISRECQISRTVIINGLRKLECAGIIEMFSKGARGTVIKIVYSKIMDIL